MDPTSASLLERLRAPADPRAWGTFVELYTPLLYSWGRRLGLGDADASDLVQDVLVLLVEKLPGFTYRPGLRFRGWLWTILHNRWATVRRHRAPQPAGEDLPDIAGTNGVVELEEAEYRAYLVGRALRFIQLEFEPTTWQAFWQCVACERSAADVGRELGLTVAAVYTAKSRVLRRLRNDLRGLLD
jgi:RNA polymerase sigma-70 factor (ECF subfamily)